MIVMRMAMMPFLAKDSHMPAVEFSNGRSGNLFEKS